MDIPSSDRFVWNGPRGPIDPEWATEEEKRQLDLMAEEYSKRMPKSGGSESSLIRT